MIAIRIDSSPIARLVSQAQAIGQDAELLNVGARGLAEKLRSFFGLLDQSRPNAMGGTRTHFWGKVRRSVQNPVVTPPAAEVSINHLGFAQRLFGGFIRPVTRKFLTIPASPEAYGKTAGEFRGRLRFGFAENRYGSLSPALLTSDSSTVRLGRKRKDGSRKFSGKARPGLVMFWLVKQVYQRPDPTVLPSAEELEAAAVVPMENYLARKLNSGGAA